MRRLVFAALALAAMGMPASAQYYYERPYPPPGWGEPPPPPPGWGQRYEYGPPGYGPPGYGPPGYGPAPDPRWRRPAQRVQYGSVCVTSRGNCQYGQAFPRNTPCSCDIPGFGPKRGAIGY
jgi:hypothetical protein